MSETKEDRVCKYCKDDSEELILMRKAVKPKGYYFRWVNIGYCCIPCSDAGKKSTFHYKEHNENTNSPKHKEQV